MLYGYGTLAVFLAVLRLTTSYPHNVRPSLQHRDQTSRQVGYISVSVATLWTNPKKPRTVNAPSLQNPVHVEEWLHSMTVKQSLDLTDSSRTQTQALYGAPVYILDSKDGWYHVAIPGQPTPKNKLAIPAGCPLARCRSIQAMASCKPASRLHRSI